MPREVNACAQGLIFNKQSQDEDPCGQTPNPATLLQHANWRDKMQHVPSFLVPLEEPLVAFKNSLNIPTKAARWLQKANKTLKSEYV